MDPPWGKGPVVTGLGEVEHLRPGYQAQGLMTNRGQLTGGGIRLSSSLLHAFSIHPDTTSLFPSLSF